MAAKRREYYFRSAYGISASDVDKEIYRTESCPICDGLFVRDVPGSPLNPVVDHCHSDGKYRGVLCRRCNSGLGFLQDSTENLKRAISYLEKFK